TFTSAEIEAVLAHELGHRQHRHIIKLTVTGFDGSMLQFWLIGLMLVRTPGLTSPADLAGFPVLWLGFALMGMISQPLMAGLSRHFERQADAYACATPARAQAMADALVRLGTTNLSDPEPPAWVEWYFYSHPALARRIAAARRRAV
ncbi:MAG TPA: M48 family metalloprotease, partial [bacterium]|nr:M48 family metalloprotease [bacterium]